MKDRSFLWMIVMTVIVIAASLYKGIKGSEYLALALVVVTTYYSYQAYLNNKMLIKNNQITFRPYMAFKNISTDRYYYDKTQPDLVVVHIGIKFMNVGKVPLKYIMKNVKISIDNKKSKNPIYLNKGSYIFPTHITTFFCEGIPGIDLKKLPVKGRLEYELCYFSVFDESVVYKSKKVIELIMYHDKTNYQFISEEEE